MRKSLSIFSTKITDVLQTFKIFRDDKNMSSMVVNFILPSKACSQ